MTLNQLKMIVAVAKCQNISKAAKGIHISQPSVSQQLKLLEEEYGVKLFKKKGHGIELTQTGQLFLKGAGSILFQVEKLDKKFRDNIKQRKVRSLVIGGSHAASTSLLPLLSAHFKETHPLVQLTLRTDYSRELEELVLHSEVEIAVIINSAHSPSLIYEPFGQQTFVIFASKSYYLARRQELTLAELARAPLVIRKGNKSGTTVDKILEVVKKRGFKLNIVMYCESIEGVIATVKAGIGLGILCQEHVEPHIKSDGLKVIEISQLKMHINRFIIYHKEMPLSPNAQYFLTLLHQWPRKNIRAEAVARVTPFLKHAGHGLRSQ